ncbi:MAG: protein kinase [Ilumatobacteraceae bacterium]
MPSPLSPLPPPPLLAQRYRLERKFAQGGMAEVWLATDMSLSRQVAVKILKSTLATDPVVAERFRREAITVARLSHPNIVAVHDTIDFDGRQAVVMQLINGKSLRQLLDEQKRLSPELTMHIGSCVASALDAAHAAGLVHRDVKPGNILITPDGRVLLTDFGIAKGLGSVDDLTSENVMMGTAKYLSPEQVRGRKLDGRADLYALGLVLYECLAGRVPFLGESDADTALARLQRDPTNLAQLRHTLPYGLSALVHELLARNPQDRPATGDELRNRLARIASGVDDRTTTMTPPRGAAAPRRPVPAPRGTNPATTPPSNAVTNRDGSRDGSRDTNRDMTPQRVSKPIVRAPSAIERPSGATPRQGPVRPINAPAPNRDRTPAGGSPRGVPAKQFQQQHTPTVFIVVLLLIATIVAIVVWATNDTVRTPTSDDSAVPAPSTPSSSAATASSGRVEIVNVASFDPGDPDGGVEKPELVALATDGDPTTAWSTNCYNDRYFNGKPGVGLVIELSTLSAGIASFAIDSAPFQVDVYASDGDVAPSTVDGWTIQVVDRDFDSSARRVDAAIDSPAKFILVLLREAGEDTGCSETFHYRGRIGEISYAAS